MDFNSILIGSDDPARLVEYYTRLLGEPVMAGDPYATWQIGRGYVTVGPHSEVTGHNAQPGRLIWNIETSDVAADFERLTVGGAIVVTAPYEMDGAEGMFIATLADPDGNYFQLMTPFAG